MLSLLVFMSSCEKEELNFPNQEESKKISTIELKEAIAILQNIQSKRNQKSTEEPYITPQWELAHQEEIKNSTEYMTVIPATIRNNKGFSRILMLEINGEVESIVFTMYPSSKEMELFSGKIGITDLRGNYIIGYRAVEGKLVSRFVPIRKSSKSSQAKSEYDGGSLDEVLLDVPKEDPNINEIYDGKDSGGGSGSDMDPGAEPSWDFGDLPPSGGGTSNPDSSTEEEEEDKIDDSELEGKEKCLNDLLDEKGDSFVQKLLANFQGDGTEFDIKIKSVAGIIRDGKQKSGLTSFKTGSSVIEIKISTTMASSRPALDVVRTILHEYCHADMYRKLNTNNKTEDELDFKNTYEAFEEGNFEASSQHESMAKLYVSEMANALKEFHKTALTGDYNYLTNHGQNPLPDSFYKGLAWRGLKDNGVAAYNSLTPQEKLDFKNSVEKYYASTTTNCPNP